MGRYIAQRLLLAIPVLLGVCLLTFLLAKLAPGDPARQMVGLFAEPEIVEQLRVKYGLNDPAHVQFAKYVWNALQGDFGYTIRGRKPVLGEILNAFPYTLALTAAALGFGVVVGVSLGVIAALRYQTWLDATAMTTALIGLSIPGFWLAILFVVVFGVQLRWVSVTGGTGLRNLILPAIALGVVPAAVLARLTRSSFLEVAGEDYARTARSKGLSERVVVLRHILRNALLPIATLLGLQFAALLGGAVFIESVFARPGLGRLAVDAINARDIPLVQGIALFTAATYMLVNLLVDILYVWLDPRIRLP